MDKIETSMEQKRELLKALLQKKGEKKYFPLSYTQQRIWFIHQFDPVNVGYNISLNWRIRGSLDWQVLEQCFQVIVDRHDSLRATFHNMNGQVVQSIQPQLQFKLERLSLDKEQEMEQAIMERVEQEKNRVFDLGQGPLFRAAVLPVDENDHVLLVNMHHIISDGWSIRLLSEELTTLYSAMAKGSSYTLAPLDIKYSDYVVWQRDWLQSEQASEQMEFWKERLDGVQMLQLPTDFPRPSVQTYRGDHARFSLSSTLERSLQHYSREHKVTLYMIFLSAFKTLMYRYSQQEDIAVGTPIANRVRQEVTPLIGSFVNTLVLRTPLQGNTSFAEVVQQVKNEAMLAYKNQDLPFEKLVEELHPDRDPGVSPLFQVLFTMEENDDVTLQLDTLEVGAIEVNWRTSLFDLSLTMEQNQDGLRGLFEYNTDLFHEEMVARMVGHFQRLLEQAMANPEQTLDQFELLSAPERQQLLVDWNETDRAYNWSCLVHQLVEEQAAKAPEALAATDADRQITYGELNERANVLAHNLRKRGARPGSYVGVCTERSVDWLVGMLGVFKSGACYVPLDPTYPEERLAYMMADANVPLLVTHSQVLTRLTVEPSVEVLCLDQESEWGILDSGENLESSKYSKNSEYRANPEPWATAQDPAYVIYTSGSTGQPKGAILRHQGLLNVVLWHQGRFGTSAADRGAQIARMGFDASLLETWPLLCSGGSVHLMEQEIVLNPEGLQHWLLDHQITLSCFLPPVVAEQLLPLTWPQDGALRALLAGGERLQMRPPAHLTFDYVNIYGPTECTILSTVSTVEAEDGSFTPPSIGGALPNTQLYVLDAHQNPVPRGVPGELYIGGVGVAIGYLNREELNAEKFVAHPFRSGERLYRTGDLVKYNPDATLSYIGRADHQVKIRGFRIELGEIESVLVGHPAVHSVIVQAREIGETGKQLVAYIATQPEASRGKANAVLVNELREYMKPKLPQFMLPAAWVVLEQFPVTPNGKVDRKALPEPTPSELYSAQDYVAPRHPVEEMLAGIWSDVLGLQRIGAHDHFFELGGHSLLATQIVSRVKKLFGIEYPLAQVFQRPMLSQMAKSIREIQEIQEERIAPEEIVRVSRERELPLSYAQQRMWFFEQMYPGNRSYHIPSLWRIHGQLRPDLLENSLAKLIQRHESLRTCFLSGSNGDPMQHILPTLPSVFTYLDWQDHSNPLEQALHRIDEDRDQAFSLQGGPLLGALLIQIAPQEYLFSVTMHHIISDGWSMSIFARELGEIYSALNDSDVSGGSSNAVERVLPELPIQYADFAVWQRKWIADGILEQQMQYWRQQLQGVSVLQLPTDYPRPAVQTFEGAAERFTLAPSLLQSLQQLSRREGVTLYMLLLSAWNVLLYRYSQQEDITVGTPIANRNQEATEGLIGFFANTLVMRAHLSDDLRFRELLSQVKEMALGAYMHQDVPFEKLVSELQPDREPSYTPLFQVFFALQNAPGDDIRLPDMKVTSVEQASTTALFDLSLIMEESGEGISGELIYNTGLFDQQSIQRMVGHLHILLEGISSAPEQVISQLPLLSKEEENLLLVEWNQTERDYSLEQCVHELFEMHAASAPDQLAVAYLNDQLSYGEMNRKANQLAHELRRRGVVPGTNVGVYIDRSPEWLTAMVAVFKSGGCYVPLDPSYPEGRLEYMMQDARVPLLIIQSVLMDRLQWTAETICIDQEETWLRSGNDNNPSITTTPDDAAYIIYTSGSTGLPKGVVLKHRGLLNVARWHHERYGVTPRDRAAQAARMGFDASILEVWPFLSAGASIHILEQDIVADAEAIRERIHAEGITRCFLSPIIAEQLLDQRWPSHGSLRTMMTGGDRLQVQPPAGLPFEYTNHYGPTEYTILCTAGTVAPKKADTLNVAPSIGSVLPNTELYVLDRQRNLVPVGVPGELYIGGVGLAFGYLNREELTAEAFIPHPFKAGERLYRTGDLVRYRTDATLEFVGRADHQVKLRGFRIELGEVESVLAGHPAVNSAIVQVRETAGTGRQLVAYFTLQGEQEQMVSELRNYMKQKLPQYMIPAAWVHLDELPLTPNGKVDRKALPEPNTQENDNKENHVTPRTPVEEVLCEIWSEVLGVTQIGVEDNFFELGGDSIVSIQMIFKANERGIALKNQQVFLYPTIAELAVRAGEVRSLNEDQGSVTGTAPLTPIQEWFFAQQHASPNHWNQSVVIKVGEPLQLDILHQTLELLESHHDALRMTFSLDDRQQVWTQTCRDSGTEVQLTIRDLSHVQDTDIQTTVTSELNQIQSSLDIEAGPLWQSLYMRMGSTRSDLLAIVIHHLVVDSVSWRILMEDLENIYTKLASQQKVRLPLKTTSYLKWSERLADYANHNIPEHVEQYWANVSEQVKRHEFQLKLDDAQGSNQVADTAVVLRTLKVEPTTVLREEVTRQLHVQVNEVLFAAFASTLANWSASDHVWIHLEGHGREEIAEDLNLNRTIGWFTSMYPVYVNLSGVHQVDGLIKHVQEQLLRIPNKGMDYGILRYLKRHPVLNQNAVAPIASFNYLGQYQTSGKYSGFEETEEYTSLDWGSDNERGHLIDVVCWISGGELHLKWMYSSRQFSASSVERAADYFNEVIQEAVALVQHTGMVNKLSQVLQDNQLSEFELESIANELEEEY
ncbi:non-ribosomal peptide synthetase [Paenibacillus xylanexedens]|uniref:non-ribosomal peptide synthetase n=1 Tax=Paenibacillus xylanexedens TaxID=528191 RepID=UPI0011A45271|nr:non-ribosomal peptide synthetase [Paenibacillus xylanexedens]